MHIFESKIGKYCDNSSLDYVEFLTAKCRSQATKLSGRRLSNLCFTCFCAFALSLGYAWWGLAASPALPFPMFTVVTVVMWRASTSGATPGVAPWPLVCPGPGIGRSPSVSRIVAPVSGGGRGSSVVAVVTPSSPRPLFFFPVFGLHQTIERR